MMKRQMFLAGSALFLAAGIFAPTDVGATIASVSPTGGSTGVLIINNACDNELDGPAMLITGCLNTAHDRDVNFMSNENIEFDAGGQAVVLGSDGLLQTLTIDPETFTLDRLILNINAVNTVPGTTDGWVQFCDDAGCFSTLFALDGNGQNFFDIAFNPAADFLTINTFSDSAATTAAQLIEDTRQWRVSPNEATCPGCGGGGGGPGAVSEPATLAIFGSGLLSLAAFRRRRSRRLMLRTASPAA